MLHLRIRSIFNTNVSQGKILTHLTCYGKICNHQLIANIKNVKSDGERILKIGQHSVKLWAMGY